MFRYFNHKSWLTSTFSILITGLLLLQTITPAIVYAISESDQKVAIDTKADSISEIMTEETVPETEEEVDSQAEIVTGNALATSEVNNEIDFFEIETNSTNTSTSSTTETELSGTVTSATPTEIASTSPTKTFGFLSQIAGPVLIEASSSAQLSNAATTSANTGNNSASDTASKIVTGKAVAYTDVLNVVNTNIVDSDGLIKFINTSLGYQNFDLRPDFDLTYVDFDVSQSTPACSLSGCGESSETTVNINNNASINNDITVVANTGSNQSTGNSATITTGDAYAAANIINVANTNIVDSNYLLLVFNNFSDMTGDIVLPSSSFFDKITKQSPRTESRETNITNSATVTNDVETVADSGNNQTVGNDSTITTGDTGVTSDVTNQINRTIIDSNSFSMLIRVHGNWRGTVNGLPEGFTWNENDQGIEIVSINNGNLTIENSSLQTIGNTAIINNDVKVYALTGDNKAEGEDVTINTGHAYADTSVLNIANTNVIGSNWSNLIFTIYGDWDGSLSFGQPNLWLGITADSPDNPIMPGSEVTYTFTVFNRGDATAPAVNLETNFENLTLDFGDSSERTLRRSDNNHAWTIGDIGPGETREFTKTATINPNINNGAVSAIPLVGRVKSSQADADNTDDEDDITIYAGQRRSEKDSRSYTFNSKFDITKTASRDLAQPGDTVDYTITLFNRGGQLYDALLVDVLENEAREIIQENTWSLDEVKNWETITINYSIKFDSSTATGTYTNSAQLVGFHGSNKSKYQTPYESPIAVHRLNIGGEPAGRVLGISDSYCTPYLTEYMKYGESNTSSEVSRLQLFLNEHLGRSLIISGYFDLTTEIAVRDFQQLYADEVLTPWGMERDSGFVYYTTQKKINEIMCKNSTTFPLTTSQEKEVISYRERMKEMKELAFNLPETKQTPTLPEAIAPTPQPKPNTKPDEVTNNDDSPSPTPPVDELISQTPTRLNPWQKLTNWWKSLSKPNLFSMR